MTPKENNSLFWMAIAAFSLILFFSGFETTPKNQSSSPRTAISSDPFIGEITMFAGNFAPRGWAFCNGQLLPISQYSALFSLLGTTYGGDGRTTFALPDLRGRTPIHAGTGPGLNPHRLGSKGGSELIATSTVVVEGSATGDTKVLFGTNQFSNMQPYATVNYIIALQGTFPSRN